MSDPFAPGLRRLRRRALIRRAAVVAVLVVVLVLAALLWPRPVPGPLEVSRSDGRAVPGGVLRGRLAAEREGDRVCYATTVRGAVAVLTFPPAWSADTDRGLLDAAGAVVAVPGDGIEAIGAPGRLGSAGGCAARGRIWAVTSIRVLDPV